jgi:hypothetical protein
VNDGEVWVEVKVRFSDDFTVDGAGQVRADGSGVPGAGLKVLHINQWGTSGRFGYDIINGDAGRWQGDAPGGYDERIFVGTPSPQDWFDDRWHTIRVHIDISGTPHVHEFWLDGVYKGQSSTTDTGANSLWSVSLNKNLNMLAPHAQEIWWGQVKIWFSDPGW